MKCLPKSISDRYEVHKETRLPYRRYKVSTIHELIQSYKDKSWLEVKEEGESIEGRSIYSLTIGSGAEKILMWTQMHGNEPTATRAVFDLLKFLDNDDLSADLQELLDSVTLKIIPVLNPDGTERYQRRNAVGIDPNRDAAQKSTPEIQTLFRIAEEFQPQWCFNMHDQRNIFNVSGTDQPATLSFLAPGTSGSNRPENQKEAMMMIDRMHHFMQDFVPGKMSRFNDEFYPTAAGDNLKNMGFRTILIESGGHREDVEREVPRKMNFLLIWEILRLIHTNAWRKGTLMRYAEIPPNAEKMLDLILRKAVIQCNGKAIVADIGIERLEVAATNEQGFVYKSNVKELGDLTYYHGYEEVDASSFVLQESIKLGQLATFSLLNESGQTIRIDNGFCI